MITVTEARETIARLVAPLPPESVALLQALGCVLREPVASAEDLPTFDRSAMDGYAVRADDAGDAFEVVGEIRAGQVLARVLLPGQALRIFTGAQLPGPGLKVIIQENTEAGDGKLRLVKRSDNTNVRLRGEDARAGEILLEPGSSLEAAALALLATIGKTSILVSRAPRILHLTTGDEVVPPEQTPGAGQIRNSNAPLIAALLAAQGVDRVEHFHAGDDLPAMIDLLNKANTAAYDLILISGGSGPGSYDFSAELFRHLGATIHFREINVRPGKPLIFGTSAAQTVFGLPGNALSHFVCFHLFVRVALDRLLARPLTGTVFGFLAEPMTDTANARETWWPARASLADGRLEWRALPWKSSGDITRLPAANSLIRVPSSTPGLAKESIVEVLLTGGLL
jgi:molybdopterin molybdotransferase